MKTRQAIALLIAVLMTAALAACRGGAKAATPTEAFKTFYTAAKDKDATALKGVMNKSMLDSMEAEAKKKNKSVDELLIEVTQRGLPSSMPETRNEKVEGDKATLEFKREGAANWSTASFVKEDGGWKINFGG